MRKYIYVCINEKEISIDIPIEKSLQSTQQMH